MITGTNVTRTPELAVLKWRPSAEATTHRQITYFFNRSSGTKWYGLLAEGKSGSLLSARRDDESSDRLIICCDVHDTIEVPRAGAERKTIKIFTEFQTYLHYNSWIQKILPVRRCCYEVILADYPRKIYFDIDMPGPSHATTIDVCEKTITAFGKWCSSLLQIAGCPGVQHATFMVFSSHAQPPGETGKRSFHIVFPHLLLKNSTDGADFCTFATSGAMDNMFSLLKEAPGTSVESFKEILGAVDTKVYKSIQQLRIVNCCKGGTGRYKIYRPELSTWKPRASSRLFGTSDSFYNMSVLHASLVSEQSDCGGLDPSSPFGVHLSMLLPMREKAAAAKRGLDDAAYASSEILLFLKLLRDGMAAEGITDFPFTLREEIPFGSHGSMIPLQRTAPSQCVVCKRVHEAEHPFMTIRDASITWNCRRSPQGTYFSVARPPAPALPAPALPAPALPAPAPPAPLLPGAPGDRANSGSDGKRADSSGPSLDLHGILETKLLSPVAQQPKRKRARVTPASTTADGTSQL